MEKKKYEITDETMMYEEHLLHRIRALTDFSVLGHSVKTGDLGGWVEHSYNLDSHEEDHSWIFDNGKAYGNAMILSNSVVRDNGIVQDEAIVRNSSVVENQAKVSGNSCVEDESYVQDQAKVSGSSHVKKSYISGQAQVKENARTLESHIRDYARILGDSFVESSSVSGESVINGRAKVLEFSSIDGNTKISGHSVIRESHVREGEIEGTSQVSQSEIYGKISEHANVNKCFVSRDSVIRGNAYAENTKMEGKVLVEDCAKLLSSLNSSFHDVQLSGNTHISGNAIIQSAVLEDCEVSDHAQVIGKPTAYGLTRATLKNTKVRDEASLSMWDSFLVKHGYSFGPIEIKNSVFEAESKVNISYPFVLDQEHLSKEDSIEIKPEGADVISFIKNKDTRFFEAADPNTWYLNPKLKEIPGAMILLDDRYQKIRESLEKKEDLSQRTNVLNKSSVLDEHCIF